MLLQSLINHLLLLKCKGEFEQIRITNSHEEANVILVNQAYDAVLQNGVSRVHVVCDDTVFALLTNFF